MLINVTTFCFLANFTFLTFQYPTLQHFNNSYFLVINGKPEGPFSIEQLKEYKIKPDDFLKTAEMDDYKEAHEMQELRELFGFSKQAIIPQYFGNFDQRLMSAALDWKKKTKTKKQKEKKKTQKKNEKEARIT